MRVGAFMYLHNFQHLASYPESELSLCASQQPRHSTLNSLPLLSLVPAAAAGMTHLQTDRVELVWCRHSAQSIEGSRACCHGPVTQAHFLEALGIRERLQGLLQTASLEEGEQLISGYYRLVGDSSSDASAQADVSALLYRPLPFARQWGVRDCNDLQLAVSSAA